MLLSVLVSILHHLMGLVIFILKELIFNRFCIAGDDGYLRVLKFNLNFY